MTRDPKQHLSEEEFRDFVFEELREEEQAAVDAHVDPCINCAKRLEEYYERDASFPEAEWAARRPAFVASLRQELEAIAGSSRSSSVRPAPSPAVARTRPADRPQSSRWVDEADASFPEAEWAARRPALVASLRQYFAANAGSVEGDRGQRATELAAVPALLEPDSGGAGTESAAGRPGFAVPSRWDAFFSRSRPSLAQLWQEFRSQASDLLRANATASMALADTLKTVVDDHSPDGRFALFAAVNADTGALTLRFEAPAPEYEGCVVVVGDGCWSRPKALERLEGYSNVCAEIRVEAGERDSIPPGTDLDIRNERAATSTAKAAGGSRGGQ